MDHNTGWYGPVAAANFFSFLRVMILVPYLTFVRMCYVTCDADLDSANLDPDPDIGL
jgi:hypothetical protein